DTEDGPGADDNSLTWSISGVDETLFTASIDSADVLTITPVLDAWGTDVVTLVLTDSGGKTDSQDIIIGVIGNVGISLIAGGVYHSYVVHEGVIWGWGYNLWGGVGDGTETQRWSPVPTDIADVTSLASGGWGCSLAVKSDGTVWGWGKNSLSELGIGVELNHTLIPVQTLVPDDITTVEFGDNHALALRSDGTVWAWGYNISGQLGLGPDAPEEVMTPVQVPDLDDVVDVAGAGNHSIAVKSDGTVWTWGSGVLSPALVSGLSDVVAVEAGDSFRMVLKSDGTVWGWGYGFGDLSQAQGLDNVISIAAGSLHMQALKSDRTVWGRGSCMGNGENKSLVWTQVLLLTDVTEIACGHYHSLARKSDGSIWAWGENYHGEVGVGDETIYRQLTPVKILPIEDNTSPVILPGISDISIVGDETPVILD
ncbi:MAG: hypothetical protein KAQ99_07935, partial [Candidatus Aureabacteria bacterium]|nr:hypothetical protein [Candidatus Auribacterota bacterium]